MSVQKPSNSPKEEKVLPVSLFESLCQCQVCFMNFNETTKIAMMLHCGHTFCTECIANVQKYGNSAHLECPTCRSETKCAFDKIPTNFLVMEMIRKVGLMGVAVSALTPKEPKLARDAQRERTIDEMVDDKYRHVIAEVKGELMSKFEGLRDTLKKSTIESAQRALDELGETVEEAIRDAYDGYSESEVEEDEPTDEDAVTVVEIRDGDYRRMDDDTRVSFIRRHWTAIRRHVLPILNNVAVENPNPLRSSSESESSVEDESGSDSDDNDESDSDDDSDEDDDDDDDFSSEFSS